MEKPYLVLYLTYLNGIHFFFNRDSLGKRREYWFQSKKKINFFGYLWKCLKNFKSYFYLSGCTYVCLDFNTSDVLCKTSSPATQSARAIGSGVSLGARAICSARVLLGSACHRFNSRAIWRARVIGSVHVPLVGACHRSSSRASWERVRRPLPQYILVYPQRPNFSNSEMEQLISLVKVLVKIEAILGIILRRCKLCNVSDGQWFSQSRMIRANLKKKHYI